MTKLERLRIEEQAFLAGWQAACKGDFSPRREGGFWKLTPVTQSSDAFQDYLNSKAIVLPPDIRKGLPK